jgi:hypothetical protein
VTSSCIFRGAKWLSVDDAMGVGISFLMLAGIAVRSGVVLAIALPLQALRASARAPLPAH